jgi:hypothetical protein
MLRHIPLVPLLGVLMSFGACAAGTATQTPDHVMIMVFDQMRPDYIDRFGLENFKRLRSSSRHYPEAYVGHLGSQTVVSHLVIPTGLLPRQLPWQDDTYFDRNGILGKAGAVYETGRLTTAQFWKLIEGIPQEQYLASRIREKFQGKVIAAGEKDYAAKLLGTPAADAIITLTKAAGRCTPSGVNVPEYIASNDRFSLECTLGYGTGYSTIYGLDGSRYVPGHDPAHVGGDIWTADVALQIMARENWSGLFLTFGGIDKIGHMLGEQDDHGLTSIPSEYHLADVLRIADQQLGRILAELNARGLSERTMIVVTADHGAQKNEFYLGNNRFQSCCSFENSEARVDPPYWIEHLNQLGKLQAGYQDTSVKLWLADKSASNEQAIVRGMADIPGMTEVYALRRSGDQFRYEQILSRLESQSVSFQAWARRHHAELLETMATDSAPDLIGLLADGYGFGRIGDHGGAQEKVQRIPMIIHVPGEPAAILPQPLRLVDIYPEIAKTLGLKAAPGKD